MSKPPRTQWLRGCNFYQPPAHPSPSQEEIPLSYADRQAQWVGVGERELEGNQAQPRG